MVAGGDTPDLLPAGPCSGHPGTGDTIAVSGQWYAHTGARGQAGLETFSGV